MPNFQGSWNAVSCCLYWSKVFYRVHVVCKFHPVVTILSGVNVDLKFWHSESAVCDAIGVWGYESSDSDSVGLVHWCTCV